MIFLPQDQRDWMNDNFCLSKRDLPTDFYSATELIEILCGEVYFRGKDYDGNSMSFLDDCLFSLFEGKNNKKRFELLFNQLHNYWIKEAEELEYYELLSNLNELNNEFIRFVKFANERQAEIEATSMLRELNFPIEYF